MMRPRPGTGSPKRNTIACSVCSTVNAEAKRDNQNKDDGGDCAEGGRALHLRRSFAISWRQGPERQIRNDTLALPAALIENDLVHAAQHPLHGLEIKPFARHLGRFLILLVDLVEAGNLTGRLGDGLKPVAFRLLNNRGGLASGLRDDPVGVGFGFVAQTVLILLGRGHVLEGGDDLLGRIDRLQLHLQHQNSCLIAIEDFLHEFLHVRLDFLAFGGQNPLDLATADDFAHGALGHRFYRFALVRDIEGIVLGVHRIDLPNHDEFDVGDIFVAGQHQTFFRQIKLDLSVQGARILPEGEADIGCIAIGDLQFFDAANRNRKVVVQTRSGLARVTAKNLIEPDFIRANRVKSGQKPNNRADQSQADEAASAHAAGPWHELFDLLLPALQEFLKFGWRPARLLSPGSGTAGFPRAAISAFTAPRHEFLFMKGRARTKRHASSEF